MIIPHFPDSMEEMTSEDEKEMEQSIKLRDHLLNAKINQMERAAKEDGRPFNREYHKNNDRGYDWLLTMRPRKMKRKHVTPGSGSSASDPTIIPPKKANAVESKL